MVILHCKKADVWFDEFKCEGGKERHPSIRTSSTWDMACAAAENRYVFIAESNETLGPWQKHQQPARIKLG